MAAPRLNWTTIKKEIEKFGSVDDVKSEFQKLVKELNKLDLNSYLSPQAQKRVKVLESRYQKFMTTMNRTQRDFDREFEKVVRLLKKRRSEVESVFGSYKAKAKKHKTTARKKVVKKSAGKKRAKR
jgi:ABC-type phosphate transport system auxiliary subunit